MPKHHNCAVAEIERMQAAACTPEGYVGFVTDEIEKYHDEIVDSMLRLGADNRKLVKERDAALLQVFQLSQAARKLMNKIAFKEAPPPEEGCDTCAEADELNPICTLPKRRCGGQCASPDCGCDTVCACGRTWGAHASNEGV